MPKGKYPHKKHKDTKKWNTLLLKQLSEASGVSVDTIKDSVLQLCIELDIDLETLHTQEQTT